MKHINLSNWRGSITDWTELNYVKGGFDDQYANIANVKGNYAYIENGVYKIEQNNYFITTLENGGFDSAGNKVTNYPMRCRNANTFSLPTGTYTISNEAGYAMAIAGYDSDMTTIFNTGLVNNPYTLTINQDVPIVLFQAISTETYLKPSAVGEVKIIGDPTIIIVP